MSYRPWLHGEALRQMGGLPPEAFDVLARTMARICENPYDRLFSMAVLDYASRTAGRALITLWRYHLSPIVRYYWPMAISDGGYADRVGQRAGDVDLTSQTP